MLKSQVATTNASHRQYDWQEIAPLWHTAAVLLLLAAFVGSSTYLRGAGGMGNASHRAVGYFFMIISEWLITAFIIFVCRLQGFSARALMGDIGKGWRPVLRDLGLAIGFLIAANIVLAVLGRYVGSMPNPSVKNLLPHTGAESVAWLLLSITAGICEEFIFRGYLQRQFAAFTRSAAVAIIIQSIIFGVSHSYQGSRAILTTSLYGCLFGLLAYWRHNLRPGMVAHFLQDGISGLLLARFALK